MSPGAEPGRWVPLAAVAALGGCFLAETATFRAVPVARDVQLYFLPHRHILWSALQEGRLPLWTPLVGTGQPVLADFQSGVFYPPHWLYAALPFLPAFNALVVLHLILGGTGAYLLARRLVGGRAPALVAAASFMLGGYFVSLTNLVNVLQTAAWVPLMVLVVLRHVRRWRPATLLQALGVYLVAFLAGAPQTFVLGAGVALAVGGAVGGTGAGTSRASWRRTAATLAALAVAVPLLAAAQLLPTLEMLGRSVRAGGLPLAEAARFSLSPVRLIHLAVPPSFGDPVYGFGRTLLLGADDPWLYSIYPGAATVALAAVGARDVLRRRLVALWVLLAALGVALALGRHLPLFPWLHGHVPLLATFRYPEKFFLLTGLSVPMLAAHGTAALRDGRGWGPAGRVAVLLLLAGGLAAKGLWVGRPEAVHGLLRSARPGSPALDHFPHAYVEWGGRLELALAALAAVAALALCRRAGWLRRRVFVSLVLAVVVLDLWVAHRGAAPTVDPSFYRTPPRLLARLPVDELRRRHRWRAAPFDRRAGEYRDFGLPTLASKWLWQHTLQPVTAVRWGIQSHGASNAIHLRSSSLRRWLFAELPPAGRARLLRLGSVSHLYAARPRPELDAARRPAPRPLPGVVHALEDPLPRAYLAEGRAFGRAVAALNAALRPSTDVEREVAVLRPGADRTVPDPPSSPQRPGPKGRGGAEARDGADQGGCPAGRSAAAGAADRGTDPGTATILRDRGEAVRVRVRPRRPSHLVLTDTWYPGWRARVDGRPRPVRRANGFFRAVRVCPGDREVVFRYRPASFRVGGAVSLASLALLAAAGVAWGRRRRRARRRRRGALLRPGAG